MTVRARYDGKAFVPIDPVDLPKDQIVELEVHPESPRKGSPEAIRALLRSLPPLEPGDAEALERSINEGKIPARSGGIFDDLREE